MIALGELAFKYYDKDYIVSTYEVIALKNQIPYLCKLFNCTKLLGSNNKDQSCYTFLNEDNPSEKLFVYVMDDDTRLQDIATFHFNHNLDDMIPIDMPLLYFILQDRFNKEFVSLDMFEQNVKLYNSFVQLFNGAIDGRNWKFKNRIYHHIHAINIICPYFENFSTNIERYGSRFVNNSKYNLIDTYGAAFSSYDSSIWRTLMWQPRYVYDMIVKNKWGVLRNHSKVDAAMEFIYIVMFKESENKKILLKKKREDVYHLFKTTIMNIVNSTTPSGELRSFLVKNYNSILKTFDYKFFCRGVEKVLEENKTELIVL